MPKRTDLRTILILGSGPIVIGQGCEFDYSGTQACKTLKAEGFRIVLVNSNPATIMTDPAFSDRTYIEPITPEAVRKIIQNENAIADKLGDSSMRIQAILPTLGGQTALNCACKLFDDGTLTEYGIEMIGADRRVIHRAEDRQVFKDICEGIGLRLPKAKTVQTLEDGLAFLEQIGLPAIIRPAFTLGGTGGGIAYNTEEFKDIVTRGLSASMIRQVQIDQSVIGWKEYELEVVRDKKDNCVIVCGIENIDPMGVHTGDSVTVAPILTLSDKEYQAMRDAAIAIMRAVGVETGGSNVQFAVNPNPKPAADGSKPFEMVVVEMNPRVSRSSALASKATGFPIAKIAAKLAVGYTLDELRNDITGTTSACFEPAIDYVVTKMPRWTFEKFPEADETLTTQMKSVGEAMSIGRTFKESFQKVVRSMDVKRFGLGLDRNDKWLIAMRAEQRELLRQGKIAEAAKVGGIGLPVVEVPADVVHRMADNQPLEWPIEAEKLSRKLAIPSQGRLYYVRYALKMGWSIQQVASVTKMDPFFIDQIAQLVEFESELCRYATLEDLPTATLLEAKQLGYSDAQLANLYLGKITTQTILKVRELRKSRGISPVYKLVDTCAAEFEAVTPYYYSTYERPFTQLDAAPTGSLPSDEVRVTDRKKVIIIGGGPNRIGQGIEFDYCCVHAAFAARDLGFESVMINSNPETVSTDYDTSDLLFFEPLTLEDSLNIIERLNGKPLGTPGFVHGVIVQFGGQTPLNLARGLAEAGVPIIGTSVDSIDLAEDRKRFDALLDKLGLQKPPSGTARTLDQAIEIANRIGYPVLVRPSYVLGGRGMEICGEEKALRHYMASAVNISDLENAPVLVDKFLDDATEVDMDVLADFVPTTFGPSAPNDSSSTGNEGGRQALVCGVMEHIEQAGIHSGDSACTLPPWSLPDTLVERIREIGRLLARELKVNGLMNVQLAVKGEQISILEVNPRASRTVPFVGKATHTPWARLAAMVMMGKTLRELNAREQSPTGVYAVKESVFVFSKFPGVDIALGPEMKSTGEVMGIDVSADIAFAKGQLACGVVLPARGNVFISVRKADREAIVPTARMLISLGFEICATPGTADYLAQRDIHATRVQKIGSHVRPNVIDMMTNGRVQMVINTPTRTGRLTDEGAIRAAAIRLNIPIFTTTTGSAAAVRSIKALQAGDWTVRALQDFAQMAAARAMPQGIAEPMVPVIGVATKPPARTGR